MIELFLIYNNTRDCKYFYKKKLSIINVKSILRKTPLRISFAAHAQGHVYI